jgi:hypothetical protein
LPTAAIFQYPSAILESWQNCRTRASDDQIQATTIVQAHAIPRENTTAGDLLSLVGLSVRQVSDAVLIKDQTLSELREK